MTNFEKFVEQNFSQYRDLGVDKRTFDIIDCTKSDANNDCRNCVFYDCNCGDTNVIKDWFNKEYTDWSKVEIDTPIFVKEHPKEEWIARNFAMYTNNQIYTFAKGSNSFTCNNDGSLKHIVSYKYARLATKAEIESAKNATHLLKN